MHSISFVMIHNTKIIFLLTTIAMLFASIAANMALFPTSSYASDEPRVAGSGVSGISLGGIDGSNYEHEGIGGVVMVGYNHASTAGGGA
jgi:hypothetical protein